MLNAIIRLGVLLVLVSKDLVEMGLTVLVSKKLNIKVIAVCLF